MTPKIKVGDIVRLPSKIKIIGKVIEEIDDRFFLIEDKEGKQYKHSDYDLILVNEVIKKHNYSTLIRVGDTVLSKYRGKNRVAKVKRIINNTVLLKRSNGLLFSVFNNEVVLLHSKEGVFR